MSGLIWNETDFDGNYFNVSYSQLIKCLSPIRHHQTIPQIVDEVTNKNNLTLSATRSTTCLIFLTISSSACFMMPWSDALPNRPVVASLGGCGSSLASSRACWISLKSSRVGKGFKALRTCSILLIVMQSWRE